MKNTTFYAICAKGLGDEDGFYKVEAENFGEYIFYHGKNKDTQNIKGSLMRDFEDLANATINFCIRKMHASGGWHDEIVHKPVAFCVEVNPSLTKRPIISFETQIEQKKSADDIVNQNDEEYYKNLCTIINDLVIGERFKFEFQDHVCEVVKYENPFGKYFCAYINAKCKISPTEVEFIDKNFSGEITYAIRNTLGFDMGHSHNFKNKNSTDVNLCLSLLKELCTILKEFNNKDIQDNFEPDSYKSEKSKITRNEAQKLIKDLSADESEQRILGECGQKIAKCKR